jgi:hypothetical protein
MIAELVESEEPHRQLEALLPMLGLVVPVEMHEAILSGVTMKLVVVVVVLPELLQLDLMELMVEAQLQLLLPVVPVLQPEA